MISQILIFKRHVGYCVRQIFFLFMSPDFKYQKQHSCLAVWKTTFASLIGYKTKMNKIYIFVVKGKIKIFKIADCKLLSSASFVKLSKITENINYMYFEDIVRIIFFFFFTTSRIYPPQNCNSFGVQ